MGLIGRIIAGGDGVATLGAAVKDVAEVFRPNATREIELSAEMQGEALQQYSEEFANPGNGGFDRFVNGVNRLPRPMLAFGTLALFSFAMVDPESFGRRMSGLALVPDPLWWLLAAIVGFYFGSREAHYFRTRHPSAAGAVAPGAAPAARGEANAALDDWRDGRS
ncbi:holin family protein [Cereibacter azotoformans]|uniref:Holin (3TMs family) n=1 Tax=Cereibacter azotoformans TaxID=43057 RepID=A0A2T5JWR8_9RHOB|nr:holin family protein [Cereibacter azotoformans]AXQ93024.1 methionine synthase I [Cereibacter sphaeroides]MBO4169285.1 holin family protein [Cereibacter azotoformans]PTR14614.1 holin (3TMs family) [Cereibacter azotoformans]UIJ31326.1 holin family protein [Cereibacter azotoformans]